MMKFKKETRAGRFGRVYSSWICTTISLLPENERRNYKENLIKELKNSSF